MKVRDIMVSDVKTIDKESTIQEAADLMSQNSIGSLIVVEDSRVIGIITERDILNKVVAESKNASKTFVKDIMTREVIMIRPDADIEDAVDVMMEKRIKKLPVVEGNALVGIITSMDVCTASPKALEKLGEILLLSKKKIVAG